MPYYGDLFEGDPGLFGSIFKRLKKIRLGRAIGAAFPGAGGVLSGLGFRPSAPAKGVVSKVHEIRLAGAGGGTARVAAPLAIRARRARATFRRVGGKIKAESSFARRRRLGLV